MKKKKLKKGNKGITLVALVVTIVVLLILAGISLNLVLGQNGIISRAQDARNQTAEGKTNTEKAINALTDEMEAYVKENEGGNGNNGGTPADLSKYNIGDEVAYTYDVVSGGNTLTAAQSGYTSDQTVAQSSTTLKWKIINKDESTRTIDIVSAEPTSNTVYFKGALGYNNGVYLLNDICEKLYSNTAKGIKARSINLEDMEKHLTDAGFTARNAYTNSSSGKKYGTTKTYTSNKKYPKLYASQIGAGITSTSVTQPDIVKTVDPYKESSKGYTTPTAETSDTAGDSGLTVTQTFYYIPINEANYGAAAAILANSNYFWVASRYVLTDSSDAGFGLRYANTDMYGHNMFGSVGNKYYNSNRLRPLVSLSSSVLTGEKDTNGAWTIK